MAMDQLTKTNFKMALAYAIIARWNSYRAAGLVTTPPRTSGKPAVKVTSPLEVLPQTLDIWKMLGGEEKASRKLEALIGDTTTAGYLNNRNAIIFQLIQSVSEAKTPKGDTAQATIDIAAGDFDAIFTSSLGGTFLDTLTTERIKELTDNGLVTIQGFVDGQSPTDVAQNVTAGTTPPAAGTTTTTTTPATTNPGLVKGGTTESPGQAPDWDPSNPDNAADDFFTYTPPKGSIGATEKGLPNGVVQSRILEILTGLQAINADPEAQNLFDAWYTWYKRFYADKFDESYVVTIDGEDATISGATAAMWTALAAAAAKIDDEAALPTDQKLEGNQFVEKPTPNTIRVNFMEKTVDGATTPRTVDITLTDAGNRSAASLFDLLSKSKLVGQLGEVDGTDRVINLHAGAWWDLKDALRNPDMLGLSDVDTDSLAALYVQLNGKVDSYSPFNPREDDLPALSAELIKTGIAYSLDPITKTPTLIDTMPWIGPSPASLTFIPQDPNDKGGPGSWRIDESIELNIGKSLQEGVPASVRPWLQAVLNAGGDMSIIDSAFPSVLQGVTVSQTDKFMNLTPDEQLNIRQRDMLKHWVGFVLGQARLASDPRYAKQPVSIPMGLGQPPLSISSFDIAMPQWVNTTEGGMDYGLGARAGLAVGAADILAAGSTWLEQYNKMDSLGQIGAGQKYGTYPPLYRDPEGSETGTATIGGTKVSSALEDAKIFAAASMKAAKALTAEQQNQAAFAAAVKGDKGLSKAGEATLLERWKKYIDDGGDPTRHPHFINPLQWNLDMTRKPDDREWVYTADGSTVIGYRGASSENLPIFVPTDGNGTQNGPIEVHGGAFTPPSVLMRFWMNNKDSNPYNQQGFYNFITSEEFKNDPANGYEIDDEGNVTIIINGETKTYDPTGAEYTPPAAAKKGLTPKTVVSRVLNANGTVTVTYKDGSTEDFPDVASTPAGPAMAGGTDKATGSDGAPPAGEGGAVGGGGAPPANEQQGQQEQQGPAGDGAAGPTGSAGDGGMPPFEDTPPPPPPMVPDMNPLGVGMGQGAAFTGDSFGVRRDAARAPTAAELRNQASIAKTREENAKAEDQWIEKQWNDYLATNATDPGSTSFVEKAQHWNDFITKGPQMSAGAKGVYTGQTVKGAAQDDADLAAFEAYEGATAGTNIHAKSKRNKAGQDTTNGVIKSEY
tara:strand:- start:1173 stop:4715 length:3543 start_codon:yes stop_codon:yes gene_type:complete